MNKILSGKNIVKTYGKGREASNALNGVNIEILAGEFVAVMGPSGCGKSTLLFALSGTDTINSGSIQFGGKELTRLNENALADIRRTKMGFVFQQPAMLKNLNILDNIILSSVQEKRKNTAGIIRKAKTLIEKTGITGLEERDITEVSGGQLQRACICRALMSEPEILFADEPTGALNSKSSEEIMELFSDISKNGMAVFLVTHDAKVASRADRVLFMNDGAVRSELFLKKFNGRDMENRVNQVILRMRDYEI
ncbi:MULTISPECIES: ABC transporter ATP-binding protein [Clostridia]|uniref:ABC transporter ATP-binding protein n=1 Tax=Clostridia TaxID=186801 RepID=UPI0012B32730|nr:ABC transporter ATP-binding protein [Clostridium sp. WB02_MRS01]MSS10241.1 ABC transporter ATP-binding protein [Clostridium sp. WB02_MRS01]